MLGKSVTNSTSSIGLNRSFLHVHQAA